MAKYKLPARILPWNHLDTSTKVLEMRRQYVHNKLVDGFMSCNPDDIQGSGQTSLTGEQYVNARTFRNDILGKEITTREALCVTLIAQANSNSYPDAFVAFTRLASIHYAPNTGSIVKNKPDWQLMVRILRSFSHRDRVSGVYAMMDDIVKSYNSVYKTINCVDWRVRNFVTLQLNADPDELVHSHSSITWEKCALYIAHNTGKSLENVYEELRQANYVAMDLLRYVRYVNNVRNNRLRRRPNVIDMTGGTEGMRKRLEQSMRIIQDVQPKNWETHLSGLPLILARRKFPVGSIVAIELEFGCHAGSKLLSLCEDDWLDIPFVTFKGDGSVGSSNGDGMHVAIFQEVNIMFNPTDPNGWKALEDTVAWLNKHGACVNATCGMHMHIDTRDLGDGAYNWRVSKMLNMYKTWGKYIVNHNRAFGHYCSIDRRPSSRYSAINSVARGKFKTLEVRIGHGTLNIHKIKAWVELNRWLFNAPKRNVNTFEGFMQSDCPHLIKAFVLSRMFKFAKTWSDNGDNTPNLIKQSVDNVSDAWVV